MSYSIITVAQSGNTRRYASLRATSRALSGNGTDSARRTITRRVIGGGGFYGGIWVQLADMADIPSIRSR